VRHGFGRDDHYQNNMTDTQKWPEIQDMLSKMYQETKKRFTDVPIIPTFGNNDMLFNY
jgi:hypothetical protein